MSLSDEFMKDLKSEAPMEAELLELSQLAESQIFLESRIKEIDELLGKTKEELRMVQEVHLPEAMAAIGMSKFRLTNGYEITIKDDVYASIRKDFVNQAVGWLDQNGLGDIVKDDITVKFARGQQLLANKLFEHCKKEGLNAEEKLTVHPQTLKATVKEQLAKGVQFPEEFFSIAPVKKSVIKR